MTRTTTQAWVAENHSTVGTVRKFGLGTIGSYGIWIVGGSDQQRDLAAWGFKLTRHHV